jgi:sec-independent protein translocase protein TatA
LVPATLKLRSIATATDNGKSPAVKFAIACGSPFSRSSKSAWVSPVTGLPCMSVTLAYTSTRLTPDVNCPGRPAPAVEAVMATIVRQQAIRATVIELADSPRQLQGAREMGSLGFPELIIILIIIIMIFGANRLPEIGRGIGKGIRNFKESTREGAKRED